MQAALGHLGRFVVRFRWLVVAVWLGGTVVALAVLPGLSGVVQTQNSAFLPADQPSVQAAQLESHFSGPGTAHTSTAFLVGWSGKGTLTPADQAAFTAAQTTVRRVAAVTGVTNLATSTNGKARVATVAVSTESSGSAANDAVDRINRVLGRTSFGSVARPADLRLALTGPLAISADNAAANRAAQLRTEVLSYVVILVILLLVYRSALGPVLNILPAALVLVLAGPVVGGVARAGLPVSVVTPIMMTVLVLGAGTDYGLFLVMRFREELRLGRAPHEAVVLAMGEVGESILFAGVTVSGALCCLLVGGFGVYRGLGPSLAIGLLLMVGASLTLTPALLAIFGTATFWPSGSAVGPHRDGLWARVAERGAQRPVRTLVVGVGVLGLLALGCLGLSVVGFSDGHTSPPGSSSSRGMAVLDANFPASLTDPTDFLLVFKDSVWTSPHGLSTLAAAEHELSRSPVTAEVNGPLDPLGLRLTTDEVRLAYRLLGAPKGLAATPPSTLPPEISEAYQLYRAIGQYVSADGRTVRFATSLATGDPSDAASVAAVPAMRSLADQVAARAQAVDHGVYGIAPYSFDVQNVADSDLLQVFPLVALVIALLLALLLRSLIAPLFLLASVGLSYASALGITNLLFVHLGHQPGVNFVLPFLLFVFLVALGEDYNILVMSRIREESLLHGTERGGIRRSVVNAVGATGSTVTSAGIILAGTFGVVGVVGGNNQLQEIGTALAIGVLLDTFVVRTLLVPSMVQLLGPWTWWPSALERAELAVPGDERHAEPRVPSRAP